LGNKIFLFVTFLEAVKTARKND